jgi:hypothetical protein
MRTQTLSSSKCSTQATVQLQPIELNSELKSKRGFNPRLALRGPAPSGSARLCSARLRGSVCGRPARPRGRGVRHMGGRRAYISYLSIAIALLVQAAWSALIYAKKHPGNFFHAIYTYCSITPMHHEITVSDRHCQSIPSAASAAAAIAPAGRGPPMQGVGARRAALRLRALD